MTPPDTPPGVYRRGDFVLVRTDGREVPATVTLASDNGRSLLLMFEGILGGFVGTMPVLFANGGWATLDGVPVALTRKTESSARG